MIKGTTLFTVLGFLVTLLGFILTLFTDYGNVLFFYGLGMGTAAAAIAYANGR